MDTVYDLLEETKRADRGNFVNNFKQKALGLTVLTAYNNATYRIDDVSFDLSPMTTFDKKGTAVTLVEYYQEVNMTLAFIVYDEMNESILVSVYR